MGFVLRLFCLQGWALGWEQEAWNPRGPENQQLVTNHLSYKGCRTISQQYLEPGQLNPETCPVWCRPLFGAAWQERRYMGSAISKHPLHSLAVWPRASCFTYVSLFIYLFLHFAGGSDNQGTRGTKRAVSRQAAQSRCSTNANSERPTLHLGSPEYLFLQLSLLLVSFTPRKPHFNHFDICYLNSHTRCRMWAAMSTAFLKMFARTPRHLCY